MKLNKYKCDVCGIECDEKFFHVVNGQPNDKYHTIPFEAFRFNVYFNDYCTDHLPYDNSFRVSEKHTYNDICESCSRILLKAVQDTGNQLRKEMRGCTDRVEEL